MATIAEMCRTRQPPQHVVTTTSDQTVAAAAATMRAKRIGSLVVVNSFNQVVGIVTERDMLTKVVAENLLPAGKTVGEIMNGEVSFCCSQDSVSHVHRIMASANIRHMPIIDDGQLVGMVSARDVMNHELSLAKVAVQEHKDLIRHLEDKHPGITSIERDSTGRIVIEPPTGPADQPYDPMTQFN